MRRTLTRSLVVTGVLGLAGVASAQTAPAASPAPVVNPRGIFEGAVFIGGSGSDTTGSQLRVGEFDDVRDRALARSGLELWGQRKGTRFEIAASHSGDRRDQRYAGRVDINRLVRAHVEYQRMPRRLDHDPLSYVDAASGIGGTFVVGHTDTDPLARYGLDYENLASRVDLVLPRAPNVRLYVSHRQETRSGTRQSLTTSHCSTCHVVSYSRGLDQRTRDLAVGVKFATSRVSIDYRVEGRDFVERDGGLTHSYSRALHPVTLAEVFLNRVQYDERLGAVPFDTTPGLKKTSHVVNARVALPGQATISGKFVASDSRNTDANLESRYVSTSGRFMVPLGDRLTFRGSIRRYDIESDSVFIDVTELTSPAGPTAGLTYAQAYPSFGSPDYVRESSRSRSPTEFSLDLAWRPWRRTTIRGGFEREEIVRDHFEVERTTTHTLTLSGRGVIQKRLQWRFRVNEEWTTDPFVHERAAIPVVLQPFASPGNLPFTGLQYYEMYRTRQADLTAFPTRGHRLDSSVTWTPSSRLSVNAHYRWRGASNDDLNFSTWERAAHAPGAEVWFAPDERWSVTAGYTYGRERLETLFTTLAFNG